MKVSLSLLMDFFITFLLFCRPLALKIGFDLRNNVLFLSTIVDYQIRSDIQVYDPSIAKICYFIYNLH